jgi:hypothetical protein
MGPAIMNAKRKETVEPHIDSDDPGPEPMEGE